MSPPLFLLLSLLYFLPTKVFFTLKIYKVSAGVVSSKTPAPDKFKEYSKPEADQRDITIHLCSMSHGKSVLKVCTEAYKLCGIESNHSFHTSETFQLVTVDVVIFVCFAVEVFFKQDHMQENAIKKNKQKNERENAVWGQGGHPSQALDLSLTSESDT